MTPFMIFVRVCSQGMRYDFIIIPMAYFVNKVNVFCWCGVEAVMRIRAGTRVFDTFVEIYAVVFSFAL